MKRFFTCILALVLLSAAVTPALALAYEVDAPAPVTPEAYTRALSEYEATQAIRLGFVPAELQSKREEPITRVEAAELSLRFIAMQYGYDLEHFLNLCGTSAVVLPDGSQPKYLQDRFKDLSGQSAVYVNWAAALGLINGEGEGLFNPERLVTEQEAAVVLRRTAEFYGAIDKNSDAGAITYSGQNPVEDWAADSVKLLLSLNVLDSKFDPTAPCTGEWYLAAFWRQYSNAPVSREKGTVSRLLSYEDELNRLLKTDGVTINKQLELGAGTVLYYTFYGTNKLDIVYRDGGCKALPMPSEALIYLSDSSTFDEIFYVARQDGVRYEINVSSLTCTPVAAPNGISIEVLAPGEKSSYVPPVVSKNEFERPAQDEKLQNGFAKPHIINIGYMPIYTDNGKEWTLSKGDMAVIRMGAERMQQNPQGQLMEIGYTLNGKAITMAEPYLLDSASFTLRVPEDGNYRFYIINKSLNRIYMRSLSIEVLHLWVRS